MARGLHWTISPVPDVTSKSVMVSDPFRVFAPVLSIEITMVSLPVPPVSVSSPAPPSSRSLPVLPYSVIASNSACHYTTALQKVIAAPAINGVCLPITCQTICTRCAIRQTKLPRLWLVIFECCSRWWLSAGQSNNMAYRSVDISIGKARYISQA